MTKAGDRWRDRCAAWLREQGYRGAAPEMRKQHGDLVGAGDRSIECTLEPWHRWSVKMRQAAGDAAVNGLAEYWLWKKRNQAEEEGRRAPADPGESPMIAPARVVVALWLELDALRAREGEFHDGFDRGYAAGFAAALQSPVERTV